MLTDGQGIQPLISLTDEYYAEQILGWQMSDYFSSLELVIIGRSKFKTAYRKHHQN